jgi:hypothetical protein
MLKISIFNVYEAELETINSANAMCSYKISLTNQNNITTEVLEWLNKAWQNAEES